ncbi:MAG: Piwi domain-containing protein [Bacteroidia bacterium]
MSEQNLILNILTFDLPVETVKFSFFKKEAEGLISIYKKNLPKNIDELFPHLSDDTEYLYVNFAPETNENLLTVKLSENSRFAKHYYTWLISNYFKTRKCFQKSNFVNDIEVWFYDKNASSNAGLFFIFKRFMIKVQIKRISDFPELQISYEGISKVYKDGLDKLNIPVEALKKVIYNHDIKHYEYLSDVEKLNISKIRPVLNPYIIHAMELDWSVNFIDNKLENFHNEIKHFVDTYLNTPEFKSCIPIHSNEFIPVPAETVFNTTKGSNELIFGNNQTDLNPFNGLKNNGPFSTSPYNKIEFIFIFHEKDIKTAEKLKSWFDGNELKYVKSLKNFIKLNYYLDIQKSITFKDLDNPMPEIRHQLANWPRISGTTYLAIYITPHPKEIVDKEIHSLYFKIKYELLKYDISSQVIETDTILSASFNFSLPNIAIAILAKLGGVPWRLQRAIYNELIVGVGAFKSYEMVSRYIGSAFCFANDGHFQNFNCYSANNTTMLAGSIREAVENFVEKNNKVERLVIHFYKRMSSEDLKPITEVLRSLNLDIPVIVININKTESRDFVVFDTQCPFNAMIPVSGTYINVGRNQFLLCNNTRYNDIIPRAREGFPFPVKLNIQSTDEKLLENEKLIRNLIDQVYQFSRMYWTSVTQQNLPVTVKYPEMVAEKYPHFESTNLPDFGKENLWFL